MKRLDGRLWLAVLVVLGAFAVALVQLLTSHADGANIPTWLAGALGTVLAFYYNSKSSEEMTRRDAPFMRTRAEDLDDDKAAA